MTTHECSCGEVLEIPAAWSVFSCARCKRLWQRFSANIVTLGPSMAARLTSL